MLLNPVQKQFFHYYIFNIIIAQIQMRIEEKIPETWLPTYHGTLLHFKTALRIDAVFQKVSVGRCNKKTEYNQRNYRVENS